MNPAEDDRLYTTTEVLDLFAPNLSTHQLQRWLHHHAITLTNSPARPGQGAGNERHWTLHEAATLALISQAREDLDALDLPMSITLVAKLWRTYARCATLTQGRITITPFPPPP